MQGHSFSIVTKKNHDVFIANNNQPISLTSHFNLSNYLLQSDYF